ncbi:MAG: hypothetical protein IJU87_08830 [Lachnospiraceae bacterium]|nr:hypothetical protein [Lachnospiraceae bacterium]
MPDLHVVKQEKKENFEAEVRLHKAKIFGAVLFVIFIVACGCLYAKHYYETKTYTGYEILGKSLRSDSDTAKYLTYNGHILKYSRDGAESYDGLKEARWNITYEMQDPRIATCGDAVAMADEGSTRILVMSGDGKQSSINTKLPVVNFSVAGQGVVAAVLEDGNSARINLYDPQGVELAGIKCSMTQSGYPIDVALSPDGTLLGVSYTRVDNETGKVHSSVAFYNFGDVGQNEIDNYVSGYDYEGAVIPRIRFLSHDSAVAVGDDRIVFFSGSQKPEAVSENSIDEEIQSLYFGDEETALVFRSDEGGNKYRLVVYGKNGKQLMDENFELSYTDIQLSHKRAIIYNDAVCEIMNYNGQVRYDGLFEDPVLLMVPTDDIAHYILVNRGMTQEIRLE